MSGVAAEAALWSWHNKLMLLCFGTFAWLVTFAVPRWLGASFMAAIMLDNGVLAGLELFLLLVVGLLFLRNLGTSRRLAAQELAARRELRHDALTGLLNRRAFFELLNERSGAARASTTVLYVDLDGFKAINDTLGHFAGDNFLSQTAGIMRTVVGAQGELARLGGDEFAVLLRGDTRIEPAKALAGALIAAIGRHDFGQRHISPLGASIGIASSLQHGSGSELVRRADIALYEAKRQGRGRALVFDVEMEKDTNYRNFMHREVRAGWLTRELSLAYQPIWSGDGRSLRGVEALMRWKHSVRGFVSPAEFIPLAEETGLIRELGAWALERACRDAIGWDDIFVSVNLSPVQLRSPDIVREVEAILARTGLPPSRLVFEITEGVLIRQTDEALARITALRALGIRIALDDFGTGYSSLAYLKRFPIDKLKIDRSFVESLGETSEDAALLGSMIALGRALGMTVVAEGVETPAQHRVLTALGCGEVQGFLFSKPRPAGEIGAMLDHAATPPALRIAS